MTPEEHKALAERHLRPIVESIVRPVQGAGGSMDDLMAFLETVILGVLHGTGCDPTAAMPTLAQNVVARAELNRKRGMN